MQRALYRQLSTEQQNFIASIHRAVGQEKDWMVQEDDLLSQEEAEQFFKDLDVEDAEIITQRLMGLSRNFEYITRDVASQISPSLMSRLRLADQDYVVSDEVQGAVEAVSDNQNILTTEGLQELTSYLNDVNLDEDVLDIVSQRGVDRGEMPHYQTSLTPQQASNITEITDEFDLANALDELSNPSLEQS